MLYFGIVVDNADPDKCRKIRVTCNALYGTSESFWIEPLNTVLYKPKIGERVGIIPKMGDKDYCLWVRIENDTLRFSDYQDYHILNNGDNAVLVGEGAILLGGGKWKPIAYGDEVETALNSVCGILSDLKEAINNVAANLSSIATKVQVLQVPTANELSSLGTTITELAQVATVITALENGLSSIPSNVTKTE
jgi:hypothetical protein